MPFQPQDEQKDVPNPNECMNVDTSQYSLNIIQNSAPPFTFSSVTNIVNGQLSVPSSSNNDMAFNNEDPDIDDKIDKLLNDGGFDGIDLPCDGPNDWLAKELATMALESIDQSIQDRTMSVETQPPTDMRRRYQSDGKRQIEKSRSKPMQIKLPNLTNCQLSSNETFWLQLILITCKEKPPNKVYIHVDKLEYHADNLPECDHGFVRIPLTQTDIQKGIKQLARISIVKSKLDTYTFELIPFNPLSIDNQIDIYENTSTKSVVAKAKCFRDAYHLKYSRIACQLLIKQDTTWHTTNIVCETSIMEEKEKQKNPKKASKRSASSYSSDEDEYPIHHQSSPKKRKQSPLLKEGLPVTHVKKS